MEKPSRLVIGTRNQAKHALYGRLLGTMGVESLGLGDFSIDGRPHESGLTAEENAALKARFYAAQTGLDAFAEDEALYVDFLPAEQQPGVHVRRIEGVDEADDDALLAHWENVVARVPEEQRTGHWHIAYCIASPDGMLTTTVHDYSVRFYSPTSSIRVPGWPMSSLQGPVEFDKARSELTESERRSWEETTAGYLRALLREVGSGS